MNRIANRTRYFGIYILTFVFGLILLSVLPLMLSMKFDYTSTKYFALLAPLYVIPGYLMLWQPQRITHRKMEAIDNRASGFKLALPALVFCILHLMSQAFFFLIRSDQELKAGNIIELPQTIIIIVFAYVFLLVAAVLLYPFLRNVRSPRNR